MAFLPLPVSSVPGAGSPNPVRVCIASYELLGPSRNGGIGTGYSALAGALAEAGHQVTLLYLFRDWCEDGTISEWEAHYGSRGIQFCPLPTSAHPAEGPQSVGISVDAYHWLSERDFDVIHFPELLGHAYYSVLAKHQGLAFHNTVLCVGVHSPISWIREINGELPMTVDEPEIDFMERESVALADTVVSPSQYLLGWLQSNGWRLPRATYVQQYVLVARTVDRLEGPHRDQRPAASHGADLFRAAGRAQGAGAVLRRSRSAGRHEPPAFHRKLSRQERADRRPRRYRLYRRARQSLAFCLADNPRPRSARSARLPAPGWTACSDSLAGGQPSQRRTGMPLPRGFPLWLAAPAEFRKRLRPRMWIG